MQTTLNPHLQRLKVCQPLTQIRSIAPEWASYADSTQDMTDNLHEVDQDACDYGDTCTGYFRHSGCVGYDLTQQCEYEAIEAELVGISITSGAGRTTYYGLTDATRILGAKNIARFENVYTEELSE